MIPPLVHGQDPCYENEEELNDRDDQVYDENKTNDGNIFIDSEREGVVPLGIGVDYSPSSYPSMACASNYDDRSPPSCKESTSPIEHDSNVLQKAHLLRRSKSMYEQRSPKETFNTQLPVPFVKKDRRHSQSERASSLTEDIPKQQDRRLGLQRAKSLLKESAYSNSPREQQLQRTASFSTLEIREYAITLGDNPGGAQGPPISLDWDYNEGQTQVMSLDDYEDTRPPRRDKYQMHMAENLRRWRLLRETGCSLKDLMKATKAAANVRKQRKKSIESKPPLMKINAKMKKKIGQMIGASKNDIELENVPNVPSQVTRECE